MSLSTTISATGISAPPFQTILSNLVSKYQVIFPTAYLGNDSADYQLLSLFSAAINDNNNSTIMAYNSYSPTYAQGTGLSSQVKINGLRRKVPSNSTVVVTVVGQAGTPISNGVVSDVLGNNWNLAPFTIPLSGTIDVLATAQQPGSILIQPGAIKTIQTPTRGFQTVTNSYTSTPGLPVESDAVLRSRQNASTSYPSQSITPAIKAAVLACPGVLEAQIYENDEDYVDTDGLISGAPGLKGHSIAVVTRGGDPNSILLSIASRKSPGCGTWGSYSQFMIEQGVMVKLSYFEATAVPITAVLTIQAKQGYNSSYGQAALSSLNDYINSMLIGNSLEYNDCIGAVVSPYFKTLGLTLNGGTVDIPIDFNKYAFSTSSSISLVVV